MNLRSKSALASGDTAIESPICRIWSNESTRNFDGFRLDVPKASHRALAEELIHLACEDPGVDEGTDRLQPKARLSHLGDCRTLQSTALRWTVESAARRSIAVSREIDFRGERE